MVVSEIAMMSKNLYYSFSWSMDIIVFIIWCNNYEAVLSATRGEREEDMYRVYRVHRDNEGNIFHRVPVGCARTEKGARALVAGQCGECVIEKIS